VLAFAENGRLRKTRRKRDGPSSFVLPTGIDTPRDGELLRRSDSLRSLDCMVAITPNEGRKPVLRAEWSQACTGFDRIPPSESVQAGVAPARGHCRAELPFQQLPPRVEVRFGGSESSTPDTARTD
jgi:hypothetical protein